MFNLFSSKYKVGQIWFYDPPFTTPRRFFRVEIAAVGKDGIQIKDLDGGNFQRLISKGAFGYAFKLFK